MISARSGLKLLTAMVATATLAASVFSARAHAELQTVTAEIPRGAIGSESAPSASAAKADEARFGSSTAAGPWIERALLGIALSSWTPSRLELESRLVGMSPAQGTGTPGLEFSYETAPWWRLRSLGLTAHFGAGLSVLRRTALSFSAGEPREARQPLYLIPLRAGAVLYPSVLRWRRVAFHAGFSAMPTFVITEPSTFDDSRSAWGVPAELTAGLTSRMPSWSSAMPDLELEVEAVTTYGKHDAMDFAGSGLRAGVRFPL